MSASMIAHNQIRSVVERIERLEAEIKELNRDKSEVYQEAKSNGLDVKVLRKVIADRRLDSHVREERDSLYDLYMNALAGGGTNSAIARAGTGEGA